MRTIAGIEIVPDDPEGLALPSAEGFFGNLATAFSNQRLATRPDRADAETLRLHREYAPILEALGYGPSQNPAAFLDGGARGNMILRRTDLKPGRGPFGAMVTRTEQEALIAAEIARRQAADPEFLKGVPSTVAGLRAWMIEREKERQAKAAATVERTEGIGGTIGAFAGAVFEMSIDSPNLAALPFGGTGRTVATRILTEALVGGTVEAAQQRIVAANREDLGQEYGAADFALNVGGAAVAAGAVRGGIELAPPAARAAAPTLGKAYDKGVETLFRAVPEPVKRRWAEAGTIDDRAVAEAFRRAVPVDMRSPDEAAALATIEREAEIAEASPFEPGLAGDAAHADRLAAAMQRILDAHPAPSRRFGAMTGTAGTPIEVPRLAVARETVDSAVEIAAFKSKVRGAESAGDPAADNPRSSAQGLYQFIDSTFIQTWWKVFGFETPRHEILRHKFDPDIQEKLMDRLTADNAAALRSIGAPVTRTNLYLAHFAGAGGARKILRADPDTPIVDLLGPDAVRRNPEVLKGKSASEVIAWAARKMGGAAPEAVEAGPGAPRVRRDAFPETADTADLDAEWGPRHDDLAGDWPAAVERLRADETGWVPGALFHPETGPISVPWGVAGTGGSDGHGLAKLVAFHEDIVADLPDILLGMDVRTRSANRIILESAEHKAAVRLDWNGARQSWLLSAYRKGDGGAPPPPDYLRGGDGGRDGSPGLGAGDDIGASAIEVKAKAPFRRRGAVDAITFLADRGGIADNEGHRLVAGRDLQMDVPFAGKLIRDGGAPLDAAGEALWEAGYFGPPAAVDRPTTAELLDYLEEARHRPAYRPEDASDMVLERMNAVAAGEAEAIAEIQDAAEAFLPGVAIPDDVMDLALALRAGGEDADSAYMQAAEIIASSRVRDHAAATGDFEDIPGFDDPVDGAGAKIQLQSLEHDVRAELKATVEPDAVSDFIISPLQVAERGEPGISVDRTLFDDGIATVVFRDGDGAAKAGVLIPLDEEQAKAFGGVIVYVDPAYRRQGIATRLYDFARDQGLPIDRHSGKGDLTPAGAAFVNARRQKDVRTSSAFRIAEDGEDRPLAEIMAELDADRALGATLRGCL